MTKRAERWLDVACVVVIALLVAGWAWRIANARALEAATVAPTTASTIAASLTHAHAPTTAYLTGAALTAVVDRLPATARGKSGKLRVIFVPARLALSVGNAVRPIPAFNVITMLPFSAKENGRIGGYYLGTWPSEHGKVGPAKAPPGAYANPAGFIEVTPENANTPVSEHFKLGDFVTHDQPNVWPKYLVLQTRIIDKLELVLADLQAHGYDVHGVKIMSGFRSPQYNYTGGITVGRADLSRHMYGDASDIYIDDDGDGQMDDLNHDGKVDINDTRVILAAVERVEAAHPELVGGAGVYTAAPGHGPFIHIDTRGYRARWVGTSGG